MTLRELWRRMRTLCGRRRCRDGLPREAPSYRQAIEARSKEALRLLGEAREAGFQFSAERGRMEIRGPASADPTIRTRLLDAIAPIEPLFRMRIRLLTLASAMGVPRQLVMRIPPEWLDGLVRDYAEWESRKDADGYPSGQRFLALYLLKLAKFDATGEV